MKIRKSVFKNSNFRSNKKTVGKRLKLTFALKQKNLKCGQSPKI